MQNPSRRFFITAAAPVLAFVVVGRVGAAENPSPVAGKRIALSGHDPVSYFTKGRPQKGSRELWFAFDDAIYLFSSAEHRALFAADPERYAPQYHGYCTIKMSGGEKAEADPEAWVVVGGKLYVFRSKKGLARFNQNRAEIVRKANGAWQTVRTAR